MISPYFSHGNERLVQEIPLGMVLIFGGLMSGTAIETKLYPKKLVEKLRKRSEDTGEALDPSGRLNGFAVC
jgi:hypothetical protein